MAKPLAVHFMGIGGSGISAVAQIAKAQGYEVSGCDLEAGRNTHYLEKAGVPVVIGHDKAHLKGVGILAHTPAVFYQSVGHPEYFEAVKRKMAMTWEEFMAKELQKGKFVVAIAGTHGKGHTSAMLGRILEVGNFDPTVEVGANLLDWNRQNFRVGQSRYFVCEADEYHDNFLVFKPNLLLITSIEMDHPDYFKNIEQIYKSFLRLIRQMKTPGILVLNRDDSGCLELAKRIKGVFKGRLVWYSTKTKASFKLQLPGRHIRADAQGAAVAAKELGVKDADINRGLESFSGLERRFEYKGEFEGVKIYDDYAHHPTAIRANIEGARELFAKKKIWVVLQPHMHTRLAALFDEFVSALREADRVVVTDVYSRRDNNLTKPTGKDLATAVGSPKATYVGGGLENVVNFVQRNAAKGDVVIVMGAGDSYLVSEGLIAKK